MRSRMIQLVLIGVVTAVAGCKAPGNVPRDSTAPGTASAAQRSVDANSTAVHAALPGEPLARRPPNAPPESTLVEYFKRVMPTNHTTVFLDSLYTCNDLASEESARWLAVAKIERIEPAHGDTVFIMAKLTTVARIEGPPIGATAAQAIEEQTVAFRMVRAAGGNWMVCGDLPDPGFSLQPDRRGMKWLPQGASTATAAALIDSIRSARGLPLIR